MTDGFLECSCHPSHSLFWSQSTIEKNGRAASVFFLSLSPSPWLNKDKPAQERVKTDTPTFARSLKTHHQARRSADFFSQRQRNQPGGVFFPFLEKWALAGRGPVVFFLFSVEKRRVFPFPVFFPADERKPTPSRKKMKNTLVHQQSVDKEPGGCLFLVPLVVSRERKPKKNPRAHSFDGMEIRFLPFEI